MKQSLVPIISNREFRPGVFLMKLDCPDIVALAKPGQFVMVDCGKDVLLRRPLSIHMADRTKGELELLFAVVGKGTNSLSQRQPGEKIDILGPSGNGFTVNPKARNLLLVAGGMGIDPLCFLAEEASCQNHWVQLCEGTTSGEQLYHKPNAATLEFSISNPFRAASTTLVGSPGTIKGTVIDLIKVYAPWADQIFACGPMAMYKAMAKMPELKGKSVQVSLEIVMGCGRGICYGCTIKTKKGLKEVCKDGPVFELDDILWDELKL